MDAVISDGAKMINVPTTLPRYVRPVVAVTAEGVGVTRTEGWFPGRGTERGPDGKQGRWRTVPAPQFDARVSWCDKPGTAPHAVQRQHRTR